MTLVNNDNLQPRRQGRSDGRVTNQIANSGHVCGTSGRDHTLRAQRVTLARRIIVHRQTRVALAARVVARLNVLAHEGARHDIGERRLTAPRLATEQQAMRIVCAARRVSGPGLRNIRSHALHCRVLSHNLIERSRPIRRRQIGDLAAIHGRAAGGVAGCCFLRCHYSVSIFLHLWVRLLSVVGVATLGGRGWLGGNIFANKRIRVKSMIVQHIRLTPQLIILEHEVHAPLARPILQQNHSR